MRFSTLLAYKKAIAVEVQSILAFMKASLHNLHSLGLKVQGYVNCVETCTSVYNLCI